MFQTKETLLTGTLRPGDDVRALQLTFFEMYAGNVYPGSPRPIPRHLS